MRFDDFQYLILMGLCLAITLPLEFVFGARVYRQPRRLVAAMAVPVAIFVAWDLFAIARGHWDFNPDYVTGIRLPGSLPLEELAFFITIPICSLLTYEAVGRVLRGEVKLPRRRRSGARS
jgi:lycopene cyclase domain-containing protein